MIQRPRKIWVVFTPRNNPDVIQDETALKSYEGYVHETVGYVAESEVAELRAALAEKDAEIAVLRRALEAACENMMGDCPLEAEPIPDECEPHGDEDNFKCRQTKEGYNCWPWFYLREARAEIAKEAKG